jgi:hypothetical protein
VVLRPKKLEIRKKNCENCLRAEKIKYQKPKDVLHASNYIAYLVIYEGKEHFYVKSFNVNLKF